MIIADKQRYVQKPSLWSFPHIYSESTCFCRENNITSIPMNWKYNPRKLLGIFSDDLWENPPSPDDLWSNHFQKRSRELHGERVTQEHCLMLATLRSLCSPCQIIRDKLPFLPIVFITAQPRNWLINDRIQTHPWPQSGEVNTPMQVKAGLASWAENCAVSQPITRMLHHMPFFATQIVFIFWIRAFGFSFCSVSWKL